MKGTRSVKSAKCWTWKFRLKQEKIKLRKEENRNIKGVKVSTNKHIKVRE